jgi:hypothetical protein
VPRKINYEAVVGLALHPIQFKILRAFGAARKGTEISPCEFAEEHGYKLSNVSYHFRVLAGGATATFAKVPLIELTRTEPRRGSVEHFYQLSPAVSA